MNDIRTGRPPESSTTPRNPRALQPDRPTVSLVSVADELSPGDLRAFVDRAARWQHLGVELVVVCASRSIAESTVSAISGGARLIYGPARATQAELRAVGISAATGAIVMLVDDPRTTDDEDQWIEHVMLTATLERPLDSLDVDREAPRA